MKKFIIICSLCILSVFIFSCKQEQDKYQTITERIVFDAKIMNIDVEADPWNENIEGPQRDKFINLILESVKSNKIKIYDKNHSVLKFEDVISNLISYDTISHKNKNDKKSSDDVIISNNFDKNKITQLKFDEKWMMNEKTYEIKKEVFGFCPIMAEENKDGSAKYKKPLFWIYPDTTIKDTAKSIYIVTKRIQYDVLIKEKEKTAEWWINNIEPTQRDTFINTIINAVFDKKLNAFDYLNRPLTKETYKELFHRVDTIGIENPETGEIKNTVVVNDIDRGSIIKIRFVEEWTLDTKTFKFYKKVLAISPMSEVTDGQGELRGYMPLFIVYFDESIKPAK